MSAELLQVRESRAELALESERRLTFLCSAQEGVKRMDRGGQARIVRSRPRQGAPGRSCPAQEFLIGDPPVEMVVVRVKLPQQPGAP